MGSEVRGTEILLEAGGQVKVTVPWSSLCLSLTASAQLVTRSHCPHLLPGHARPVLRLLWSLLVTSADSPYLLDLCLYSLPDFLNCLHLLMTQCLLAAQTSPLNRRPSPRSPVSSDPACPKFLQQPRPAPPSGFLIKHYHCSGQGLWHPGPSLMSDTHFFPQNPLL